MSILARAGEKRFERSKNRFEQASNRERHIDKMDTPRMTFYELYNYAKNLDDTRIVNSDDEFGDEFHNALADAYIYRNNGIVAVKPIINNMEYKLRVNSTQYFMEDYPELYEEWEKYEGTWNMLNYYRNTLIEYGVGHDVVSFIKTLGLGNDDAIIQAYSDYIDDHDPEKFRDTVKDFVNCYGDDDYDDE